MNQVPHLQIKVFQSQWLLVGRQYANLFFGIGVRRSKGGEGGWLGGHASSVSRISYIFRPSVWWFRVPSHSEEGKIRVASALQNVRKKRSSQRSVCALSSAARILFASIPGIGSCVFGVNSPLLNERAPRWSSVGQRSSARTQPRRQGALSEGNMRAKQTAPSSTVRGI